MIHTYASKPTITQRINFRVITVLVIFAFLVGYPVMSYVRAQRNHGIEALGGNAFHVDLKALGYFPFDEKNGQLTDVPQKYLDLDGKQVTVEGYMFGGNVAMGNVRHFEFVYNVQKCCFGGPPKVQERIFGVVPPSKEIPAYNMYTMLQMTGTLHVKVVHDDAGSIQTLYSMDVQEAHPIS